ncbi:MAG: enoyl-CoA hydratase/isomerase family protein [Pseudomonadota bacterium]
MNYVTISREGRIATVRFDRDIPANPLSYPLMRELTQAARSFENDAEISAVVLAGRADNFSMGVDLKDPETQALRDLPQAERRLALQTGMRMCRAWEELQALTISAIEGWCVGGGAALSVSTDLRIMGASGTMYVPEIERGMNMSWGAVPRITNLVGPAKAKRIVILAEKLSADQAQQWGLVDEVVRDGTAVEKAREMAARAASLPPVALRMCKQDINAYANALAWPASHADFDQYALAQSGDDFKEGVDAFLEKRPPNYSGG